MVCEIAVTPWGQFVEADVAPLSHRVLNGASPFIAADVGGTHVRLGLVRPTGHDLQPVEILSYRKYACADYGGLAEIIGNFLDGLDGPRVRRGVIASAGFPLEDGTVITANLPWRLSPREIQGTLGLDDLRLVNDFEAVAYAAALVGDQEVLRLTGPATVSERGPTLVLGPGTGLGGAVWIPTGRSATVLATEAGQAALSVGTELEMRLLAQMLKKQPHVPVEHALSGPGLLNLYRTLCEVRGVAPEHFAPNAVTAAASHDPLAREALEVFCGLLGSTVGDMALLYGITGGVYLAGGILPRIREFLLQSSFVERFLNKGPMRAALERIPVRLVEHGQLGVLGAANWYLGQTQQPH